MTTNTEAAREYLTERRNRLASEISVLEGRMKEIQYLLEELGTPIAPRAIKKRHRRFNGKKQIVWDALLAAGENGLTRDDVSRITGVLLGTASSNLAQLKKAGLATHKIPKYYAVVKSSVAGSEETTKPTPLEGEITGANALLDFRADDFLAGV